MLGVAEQVLVRTIADLQACLPNEGVGLWSGRGLQVTAWTPLPNVAASPDVRYAVAPSEWLAAWQQVTAAGDTPLALVHSHPTAEPVPSAYDRAHWHYPELWCVIVSFAAEQPRWQCFRLNGK